MIGFFALVVLFVLAAPLLYIWRIRGELEAVINQLTRRIDALERLQTAAPPAPRPVPARVEPPPQPLHAATVVLPPLPVVTPPPAVHTQEPPYEAVAIVATESDSLETEIGSRWMLYVGVLALVIGAAYFQQTEALLQDAGFARVVVSDFRHGLFVVAARQLASSELTCCFETVWRMSDL